MVEVVFPLSIDKPLLYNAPSNVKPGMRIIAPLRKKNVLGFVYSICEKEKPTFEVKNILEVVDKEPIINESLIKLIKLVSEYYVAPPGLVFYSALPPYVREGKKPKRLDIVKFVKISDDFQKEDFKALTPRQREVIRLVSEFGPISLKRLEEVWGVRRELVRLLVKRGFLVPCSEEEALLEPVTERVVYREDQIRAIDTVCSSLGSFKVFLLFGPTGSGKTEVYKAIVSNVLSQGKGAIVLVPEISLTPHYIKRFAAVFGDSMTVFHSGLSNVERYRVWMDIKAGKKKLVIGTRSAVFLPVPDLGVIIVDEEHDPSYKQKETPCYNGRDVAIMRASIESVPVVLGSATPRIETYYLAQKGKYILLKLEKASESLRSVSIVDLRKEKSIISHKLKSSIKDRLIKNEQVAILYNRRGFFRVVVCDVCNSVLKCPLCDISLVVHSGESGFYLKCHICNYKTQLPEKCLYCNSGSVEMRGIGIQRLESILKREFPEAKIARIDLDSAYTKYTRYKILEAVERGDVDIIVGTQMISKGHHFPNVTLSVILIADQLINLPDFRGAERTFQLVAQMVGRTGRSDKPSEAIVQTFMPTNYAIRYGAYQDYDSFFKEEIKLRKTHKYPPFYKLARLTFKGKKRDKTMEVALKMTHFLKNLSSDVEVIGPSPLMVEMAEGFYRWGLLIKSKSRRKIISILSQLPSTLNNVKITKDVDPIDILT